LTAVAVDAQGGARRAPHPADRDDASGEAVGYDARVTAGSDPLPLPTADARSRAGDRITNLVWGGVGLVPLSLARMLTPAAEGMGTHRQLGLPPCTFLYLLGVPCPFCGMTTSWSHAAHLQLWTSFKVQPMGLVLFAITAAMSLGLIARAIYGARAFRPVKFLSAIPPMAWWSGFAGVLLAWGYKSALVLGWI
jgi:hypothetical protein